MSKLSNFHNQMANNHHPKTFSHNSIICKSILVWKKQNKTIATMPISFKKHLLVICQKHPLKTSWKWKNVKMRKRKCNLRSTNKCSSSRLHTIIDSKVQIKLVWMIVFKQARIMIKLLYGYHLFRIILFHNKRVCYQINLYRLDNWIRIQEWVITPCKQVNLQIS